MRKSITRSIVALLAALALSQIAMAQGRGGRPVPDGFIREGVPAMPNPPGPAPKRDLSGAWVGPNFYTIGPIADLTPAGRALFEANHRYLTSHSEIGEMLRQGWIIEGTVFCSLP